MNSILKRPVIVGVLIGATGLVALIVALSLSGGSGPTAGATAAGATTTSSPAAQTTKGRKGSGGGSTVSPAQGWHDLAQCFRSHGYAIADPTVNADGTSSWSSSAGPPPPEVRNAQKAVGERTCGAQWHALPPQIVSPPPTPAELHGLVLFAGCMRSKGLADWPDPNSTGAFPLNARLLALGKRGIITQLLACSHFNLGNGIAIAGPANANAKKG
ncbi:MAG TPA: hypothetical protein VH210_12255 [Gaiellaceae bacterium]|jgi:hypothetical protein|nr:hypothetical protein [Gaiellaceae bacterium]